MTTMVFSFNSGLLCVCVCVGVWVWVCVCGCVCVCVCVSLGMYCHAAAVLKRQGRYGDNAELATDQTVCVV